ncbi:MAG: hypothetical protein U5K74_14035 [Gemmatimonadaceae bacterium]|nr:hypothetical protein [Gemmatimonadaceae bacterium]
MLKRSLFAGLMVTVAAPLYFVAPGFAYASAAAEPAVRELHSSADMLALDDSLLGRSGKLRARFLPVPQAQELERAIDVMRASPAESGLRSRIAALQVLPIVPFQSKVGGRMGMYRMGFWPGEKRVTNSEAYGNPSGFVEVTPLNQNLQVSEHFRLRDFVTKDQADVWPKYVVLREALVDKLELVIDELAQMGHPVQRVHVMSGFRHPFYNQQGVGRGGRARDSRHQYGDASDVFVDNDADGNMDDLDGDGRVTVRDSDLIIRAVERVELAHPELIGGMGRYHATHAHGPFVHVDVRGTPARWGGA